MKYKIGKEAKCAVIGYGSWATAIVSLLTQNEDRVGWYVRNHDVLEGLTNEGRNPKYLNDLEFDRDKIAPSNDINKVVQEADILIMAVPSAYLKDFLAPLKVSLQDKFIVSAIKGIIPMEYQTVAEYLKETYDLSFK
ncbi:NAD-dependent glycerol-3-phosphate dehydrogenase, partial [gut metagenome]